MFLDSLFSAVENFTVAARDFHQRLDQLDTSKYEWQNNSTVFSTEMLGLSSHTG